MMWISGDNSERYLAGEEEVDLDVINNLFGTNNKPPYEIVDPEVDTTTDEQQCHDPNQPTEDHSPSITVDDEERNCLEYADQGFRWVSDNDNWFLRSYNFCDGIR